MRRGRRNPADPPPLQQKPIEKAIPAQGEKGETGETGDKGRPPTMRPMLLLKKPYRPDSPPARRPETLPES
ncbi:hypothetical protein PG997_005799 [Apiospora hydei]|uniref:Uncharacterized protein n=1 Tax=Apiospora hydei TaxID=1337664 RepID=A0ABR1WR86_9PEZI